MKKIILALLLISFLALPIIGLAVTPAERACIERGHRWVDGTCVTPAPAVDPITAILRVRDLIFGLFLAVAFIFFILGAFAMLTSAGDEAKFTKGRTQILYAAIAVAVAFMANAIITWVSRFLG